MGPAAAVPPSDNQNQIVILPVSEVVGFSLSTNTLTFNNAGLGTSVTTPNYSITNLGNVPIDLSIKAVDDFQGPEQLNLNEGQYSVVCQNINTLIDKDSATTFKTDLLPKRHGESTLSLYQQFNVPYGVTAGSYNTTVTYTAIKSKS